MKNLQSFEEFLNESFKDNPGDYYEVEGDETVPVEDYDKYEHGKILTKRDKNGKLIYSNKSQVIEYKGKTYWIEDTAMNLKKYFAYEDPDLKKVAKINGKTLMFKSSDITELLK